MKLLPCPFCGSSDTRIIENTLGWEAVRCVDCGSQGRSFYYDGWGTSADDHLNKIKEAWNNRTAPKEVEG